MINRARAVIQRGALSGTSHYVALFGSRIPIELLYTLASTYCSRNFWSNIQGPLPAVLEEALPAPWRQNSSKSKIRLM